MSETRTETLDPEIGNAAGHFCEHQNVKDDVLDTYKPTHVVTAITYGGDAHIRFQQVIKKKRYVVLDFNF